MSTIVILRMKGDPEELEQIAREDPGRMPKILDHAKQHGVIHHRFFGAGDEIIVVDEWESQEGFEKFFEHDEDIPPLMQDAGVTSEPEISFYRPLETGDEI